MTYEELKQACAVLGEVSRWRDYVSKDRFVLTAKARFGIEDERLHDVMYGLVQMPLPRLIAYMNIDRNGDHGGCWMPRGWEHVGKAVEIMQAAYALRPDMYEDNDVPSVDSDHGGYRYDRRRYFYTRGNDGKILHADISLARRNNIALLAELLSDGSVKMRGVAHYIDSLDGELTDRNKREQIDYYDGDCYLLWGNPADRVFYDYYSRGGDAGLYMATDKGWRKLLYTPGRGYLDKDGQPQYVDDDHFYSNYMLEASGKGFRYVGNLIAQPDVLRENSNKED